MSTGQRLPAAAAQQLTRRGGTAAVALPPDARPAAQRAARARVAGAVALRAPVRSRLLSSSAAAARRARAGVVAADGSGGADTSVAERRMSTSYAFAEELFTDAYQFIIPAYQRVYEWEKEEVERLLNDLDSRLDTSQDVDALEAYQLGMLTLKRWSTTSSDKRHDVVDGQQRLTTLSLILACVKQHLGREDAADSERDGERRDVHAEYEDYLMQKPNKLARREAGPRLQVWLQARPLYPRALEARQPQDWAAAAGALTPKEVVAARMARNMGVIADYLRELRDDAKVEQLAQYILLRCEFAVSVTADQQLAVQVFRAQTGRGKDLQPSDILKAELVAAVTAHPDAAEGGEEAADRFAQWWQDMEADVGRERLQELLLNTVQLHDGGGAVSSAPAANAFAALFVFTDRLRKQQRALPDFALRFLPNALDAYRVAARLRPYGSGSDSDKADVGRLLAALSYNNASNAAAEWTPLAMRVLMRCDAPCATAHTLRRVEKLAAYLTMCKSNSKARAARFAAAHQALAAGDTDAAPLRLSEAEAAEMRAALDDPALYSKKKCVKLVLLRADLALRDSGAAADVSVGAATVEHVLPQEPHADSVWRKDFSDAERAEMTNSEGNLLLIVGRKNSSAGRLDYEQKKEKYFKHADGTCSYTGFSGVTDSAWALPHWTPAVVLRRHKQLRDALCGSRGWDL